MQIIVISRARLRADSHLLSQMSFCADAQPARGGGAALRVAG
jgi:hypothetical protein